MTRMECERKLLALAEQMYAVYKAYNPASDQMSMTATRNGYISVHDCHFSTDRQIILDANGYMFKTIDCTRYSDGDMRIGNITISSEVEHEEAV